MAEDIRDELERLGEVRKQHAMEDKELAREIRRAVKKAQKKNIPISEAARLLGIHRTTLYRVYRVV